MLLRFKKNQLRQPPQGWHYIEDRQTITGVSPEDVEQKIVAYRIRNGRPPGNPHHDMLYFWFDLRPEFLEQVPDGAEEPEISPPDALGGVLRWLQRLTQQGSDIETGPGVAGERAAICLACPHNVSLPGDQAIKSEIDRRSFMLRKGEVTPGLHFCDHHKMDLRVAVRLRTEFLSTTPWQPGACWVRS